VQLDQLLNTRSNNFNLIRIFAASLVLFTHSYVLSGNGHSYLDSLMRIPLSHVAVDIFFFTSGLLICKSFAERKNLTYFLMSRALRIFPALICLVLVTVFVVGPIMTTLPIDEYLQHPDTLSYVTNNINLFNHVTQYYIPGVMTEGLPVINNVNGSLWTLPWEIYMYISVIFYIPLTNGLSFRNKVFLTLGIVLILNGIFMYHISNLSKELLSQDTASLFRFVSIFYTGVLFYFLKHNIRFHTSLFLLSATIFLLFRYVDLFSWLYPLALAYCILYLAYVPKGAIRNFNKMGDFSYGVYIYAFPVQQILVYTFQFESSMPLFISSSLVTFLISALSWHLIEKRALNQKQKFKDNSPMMNTLESLFSPPIKQPKATESVNADHPKP
jgi:peptidoglycan/LPS O-acetylase OafA/YrhL